MQYINSNNKKQELSLTLFINNNEDRQSSTFTSDGKDNIIIIETISKS